MSFFKQAYTKGLNAEFKINKVVRTCPPSSEILHEKLMHKIKPFAVTQHPKKSKTKAIMKGAEFGFLCLRRGAASVVAVTDWSAWLLYVSSRCKAASRRVCSRAATRMRMIA